MKEYPVRFYNEEVEREVKRLCSAGTLAEKRWATRWLYDMRHWWPIPHTTFPPPTEQCRELMVAEFKARALSQIEQGIQHWCQAGEVLQKAARIQVDTRFWRVKGDPE